MIKQAFRWGHTLNWNTPKSSPFELRSSDSYFEKRYGVARQFSSNWSANFQNPIKIEQTGANYDSVLWKRCQSSCSGRISFLNNILILWDNTRKNGVRIVKIGPKIKEQCCFCVLNAMYTKFNAVPLFLGGFEQFAHHFNENCLAISNFY